MREPKVIQIEVNTDCDLRCPFCPAAGVFRARPRRRVTEEEFRTVFGRFRDLHHTIFSGFGEALLHPDLWRFVCFEKERGHQVSVATNGMLLNEEACQNIVALGVDRVLVTLDTLSPEHYASLRGSRNLPTLLRNLVFLADCIRDSGAATKIVIQYIVMRSTRDNMEAILGFMAEHELSQIVFIRIMKPAGQVIADISHRLPVVDPRKEYLSWEEYEAIDYRRIARLARDRGITVQRSDRGADHEPGCGLLESAVYITVEWDVTICPFMAQFPDHRLGNLLEQTIEEIYADPPMARLRHRLTEGTRPDECCECTCHLADEHP